MAGILGKAKLFGTDYQIASTAYCVCATSASEAAKVANLHGESGNTFELMDGITVHVLFQHSNTAKNPTLNVNGTGAKDILLRMLSSGNTAVGAAAEKSWAAGDMVTLTYTGSAWIISSRTTLGDLGITATAAELNYVDGVTSNIQTQLNGKAPSSHTHTTTIAESTGTNELTLKHGTKYAVTAGGDSFVFTMPSDNNTNYYHTTGSWSGLTYTAKANGGAGALAFTIPTGTSATTVAVGNHSHSGYLSTSGGTVNGAIGANQIGGTNLRFGTNSTTSAPSVEGESHFTIGTSTNSYVPALTVYAADASTKYKYTFPSVTGTLSVTDHTHSIPALTATVTGASYTPAGSVTVTPNTTSVYSITAVGSLPSLTVTATDTSKITAWNAGSAPTRASFTYGKGDITASFADGCLTITSSGTGSAYSITGVGSVPSLTHSTVSVGSASGWSAGTLPTKGSATTVATGIKSASFSGTAATIKPSVSIGTGTTGTASK